MVAENISKGFLSQMQIPPGKKADEIKSHIDEHNQNVRYNVNFDSNQFFHIETMKTISTNRNILRRSVVWDCLNKTTIVPAQQLQKELQEHTSATKCKVTKSSELNRQNLDTKAGLYVCGTVLQEAKDVQANKCEVIRQGELSKARNMLKKTEITTGRKNTYLTFAPKIINKGDGWLQNFNAPILNDVYTFVSGKIKDLVNKKKDGVVDAIIQLSFYKDLLKSGNVLMPSDVEEDNANEGGDQIIPALMVPITIVDEGGMDLFAGNNQSPEDMIL